MHLLKQLYNIHTTFKKELPRINFALEYIHGL